MKQYLTWKKVWEENCHSKRQQIIDNLPQIHKAYENTALLIRGTLLFGVLSPLKRLLISICNSRHYYYFFMISRLAEALAECFDPIMEEAVLPRLPEVINIMSDSVSFTIFRVLEFRLRLTETL